MHADHQTKLFQVYIKTSFRQLLTWILFLVTKESLVWEKLLFFTAGSSGGSGSEQHTRQVWPVGQLFHLQEWPLSRMEYKKTGWCKSSEQDAQSMQPTARPWSRTDPDVTNEVHTTADSRPVNPLHMCWTRHYWCSLFVNKSPQKKTGWT